MPKSSRPAELSRVAPKGPGPQSCQLRCQGPQSSAIVCSSSGRRAEESHTENGEMVTSLRWDSAGPSGGKNLPRTYSEHAALAPFTFNNLFAVSLTVRTHNYEDLRQRRQHQYVHTDALQGLLCLSYVCKSQAAVSLFPLDYGRGRSSVKMYRRNTLQELTENKKSYQQCGSAGQH